MYLVFGALECVGSFFCPVFFSFATLTFDSVSHFLANLSDYKNHSILISISRIGCGTI